MSSDQKLSDKIEQVTERIVEALSTTGTETEEYGEALQKPSGGLEKASDIEQILGLVEHIIAKNQSLSLIMADLDHFEEFNDNHGYQLGDQGLRLVGRTLFEFGEGQGYGGPVRRRAIRNRLSATVPPQWPKTFGNRSQRKSW